MSFFNEKKSVPNLSILSTAILFVLLLSSCLSKPFQLGIPIFEQPNTEHTLRYDPKRSSQYAQDGWNSLYSLKRSASNQYSFLTFCLKNAQIDFDHCWEYDPDNYNAYWGWGIICTEAASLAPDAETTEQYLLNGIRYLQLATTKNSFPQKRLSALQYDLSNLYIGLGAFYEKFEKPELSRENLEKAYSILLKLQKNDPENGGICQQLSFNAFYLKDFEKAEMYREKAEKLGVVFSPDFLKDLESAKKSNPVSEK